MADEPGIPCPLCGEPLPAGAEACGECGASVSEPALRELMRVFGIGSDKAHELFRAGYTSPGDLGTRAPDDVLKEKRANVLYLCPECGAFVSSGDRECGRCGAKLAEEPVEIDTFLAESQTRPCPSCGDSIPADAIVCPSCGVQVAPGIEGTTVICSHCGATVDADLEACDTCGTPLGGIAVGPVAAPGKRPVCPSCGAILSPEATVCEMCGREVGSPAEVGDAEAGASEPMPERVPESETEEVLGQRLESFVQEIEAQEAVEDLYEPRRVVKAPAELTITKVPQRGPPRASPTERFREVLVFATAGALVPATFVASRPSEVGGWAILATFVSLFASGLALLALDRARLDGRRALLLAALGGVLLLSVPLRSMAGTPGPDAADLAVAVLGTALGAGPYLRSRRAPDSEIPWAVALPGLVAMSAGVATGTATGSPAVSTGTWAALGACVGVSVALALLRRWVAFRVGAAVERAKDLATRKEYVKSIAELDRAIRLTGEHGPDAPWYSKGAALVVLGRYEEALACIDTALRINPRNEVAWVNKGNALARMGRAVDALRCYNSAIKVNPRYEVAWNNKGNTLARLGKFPDALKCYENALAIDSEYRGAWVNKGFVHTKLGDFEAAAACADEALKLARARAVGAA